MINKLFRSQHLNNFLNCNGRHTSFLFILDEAARLHDSRPTLMNRSPVASPSDESMPNATIIHVSSSSEFENDVFMSRTGSLRRTPFRPTSANQNRPRSPRTRSRGSPVPPTRISPFGKVEIFVRCEDLPKMDSFSSSDPICVLYVRKYGQWVEYGRTECIPNNHRPKVRSIKIRIHSLVYVHDTHALTLPPEIRNAAVVLEGGPLHYHRSRKFLLISPPPKTFQTRVHFFFNYIPLPKQADLKFNNI